MFHLTALVTCLATLTYPSGLVVQYVYTALGYLAQLKDNATGATLWTAESRDAEMHLTEAQTDLATCQNAVTAALTSEQTTGTAQKAVQTDVSALNQAVSALETAAQAAAASAGSSGSGSSGSGSSGSGSSGSGSSGSRMRRSSMPGTSCSRRFPGTCRAWNGSSWRSDRITLFAG